MRKPYSEIRERVKAILKLFGPLYGWQIAKIYRKAFGEDKTKSIYYHLKKGVELGEIEVVEVREEEGDFSWGRRTERIYYKVKEGVKVRRYKELELLSSIP